MLDEKDSHEGTIRFLAMFQHAVQSPMDVEPTERPLHLPPLAAITPVVAIFGRAPARNGDMVLTIGGDGNNASLTQGAAMRFAIVAFVQTQAVGVALALANANTSEGLPQLDEVIAVGFTQREV